MPFAPVSRAADLFTEQVVIFDSVSTKTLGRWDNVQGIDRIISGVIQTRKAKKVDIAEDGAISDGDVMLHTRETLTAYDLSQDGQVLTQTFARYGGEVWKLSELTDWPVKTQGYNLYYLTKATSIGGI